MAGALSVREAALDTEHPDLNLIVLSDEVVESALVGHEVSRVPLLVPHINRGLRANVQHGEVGRQQAAPPSRAGQLSLLCTRSLLHQSGAANELVSDLYTRDSVWRT